MQVYKCVYTKVGRSSDRRQNSLALGAGADRFLPVPCGAQLDGLMAWEVQGGSEEGWGEDMVGKVEEEEEACCCRNQPVTKHHQVQPRSRVVHT